MPRSSASLAGFLSLPVILCQLVWGQSTLQFSELSSLKGKSSGLLPGLMGNASTDMPPAGIPDQTGQFEPIIDSLYIVGPGDFLGVGMGGKILYSTVNPEGLLVFESIGPIEVGDKTLRDAKKIIIERAGKFFKESKVYATLVRIKKINVSIVGEVVNPGLYEIEATARLTDILKHAGGFGPNASKRVKVSKRDGRVLTYDLNKYFRGNELAQNPYLNAGDQLLFADVDMDGTTVKISEHDQIVTVQTAPGQSVYDLILEYFTFRKIRDWDYVKIYEEGSAPKLIDKKDSRSFIPKSGDILELQSYKPMIFVSGEVQRPTSFEFNANYNALDYIANAGIMPSTGNYQRVRVIDNTGKERTINSSLDRIAPGDHIIVPQSGESHMRDYVTLLVSIASIVSSIALTIVTIRSTK